MCQIQINRIHLVPLLWPHLYLFACSEHFHHIVHIVMHVNRVSQIKAFPQCWTTLYTLQLQFSCRLEMVDGRIWFVIPIETCPPLWVLLHCV